MLRPMSLLTGFLLLLSTFLYPAIYVPYAAPFPQGGGVIIHNYQNAQINVTSNMPQASWTLMRNDVTIFQGTGDIRNYAVLDSNHFQIIPQQIEGYEVRITPQQPFSVYPGQIVDVQITYEKGKGFITLDLPFPEDESLTLLLKPEDGSAPLQVKLRSFRGRVTWRSPPLPTGAYQLSLLFPHGYEPLPPQQVIVKERETAVLRPNLTRTASIRVVANVPGASYLLRISKDSKVWRGEGREYTFRGLSPATYLLSFATDQPEAFIPPAEMRIYLSKFENRVVKATFQVAGNIIVNTNVKNSKINFQPLGTGQKAIQEQIQGSKGEFTLPEGRYRVTISPPEEAGAKLTPPLPVEVRIEGLRQTVLQLPFKIEPAAPEKTTRLTVSSNIPEAGFTVKQIRGKEEVLIGHYNGKTVQVTLPSSGEYRLVFDDLPNFRTPEAFNIKISEGQARTYTATWLLSQQMAEIPAGRAIIGEAATEQDVHPGSAKIVSIAPFSIAIFEVTNTQYAQWLTEAVKTGSVVYTQEGDARGQVVDSQGKLLCKTFQMDSNSQISANLQTIGTPLFTPLPGKDSHPVIDVTWHGAMAYCHDNQCRLPTEAEWEKAGGMAQGITGQPLRKYKFGFGRDQIDGTWANYKEDEHPAIHFQVLTTPVGFYNGVNTLPLSEKHRTPEKTNLAKSPYGLFDVSGNVWEWVSDWYEAEYLNNMSDQDPQGPSTGEKKVAKGGSYDTPAHGVRVAERIALPPDHADVYTGFRIAIDAP